MARPCSHPARRRVLRGIEKHKEHVPCHTNPHHPPPSARSVSTSAVPGVGPIISSAVVAAIGNGAGFTQGRDFGAWLGLVPKQESTGDRTILGKISKRGNKYLRTLFVQAAHVVLARRPRAAMRGLWP